MAHAVVTSNTVEFLSWLAARPRSYSEAIEAWHTHCPRLTVWEDALIDGLIRIDRSGDPPRSRVVLTAAGEQALRV